MSDDKGLPPFPAALAQRLTEKPPGRAAMRAASPQLTYGRHFGPPSHDARPSAVLISIFERDGEWRTTLTRRPETLKVHSGQICFPGGRREPGEDSRTCAQREWSEELGGDAPSHQLGELTPLFVFASNHYLRSHVFYCEAPEYEPNAAEVAEVLEAPLWAFAGHSTLGSHWISRWGARFRTPHFDLPGGKVWGATALLLRELGAVTTPLLQQ